jgi:hypothetical protein
MQHRIPRRFAVRIRTLAIAALALTLSACSALAFGTWDVVRGNGTVRLEDRDVPTFTGIENQGSGLVRFSRGATPQVTVESDANILPYLETEVRNGILVLHTRPGSSLNPTRLVYRITAPDLRSVGIEGSGDFHAESPLQTDRLAIAIEGSGSLEAEISVDEVSVRISGSGDVALGGTARDALLEIDGSGSIAAADLACVDAQVVIQGSGSATLQASRTLTVEIRGSGDVRYRGGAKVVLSDSGSGTVREF